jgi:lysophospholipase L1-like esterase
LSLTLRLSDAAEAPVGNRPQIVSPSARSHSRRTSEAPRAEGLGAVSLLRRNPDALWPEFRGLDLETLAPGARCTDLTFDGATTDGVLGNVRNDLEASGEPALVTVTVGGNDLLSLVGIPLRAGERGVDDALVRVSAIVDGVRERLPSSTVLLGTVYDPTDGTGRLEGHTLRREEMGWLARFNGGIADLCQWRGAALADIHRHFLGHGVTAPEDERWYWRGSIIEPSARGASEVRRLWLRGLGLTI